ncbi:(2Fe-2S)-binding protein [Iamia majanohamensis]|uniref:(2Fe-2S)-binding protein n=1 Tax=Iamia majanohamensis TaxID=467976 RepID=A0AAF0BW52_9ACTN|nr:(2Fe-2S)-binding protein [Iamia majanohamensis]WCO67658.1 (2Fe-2S)-binding protein [Iamia majanohamensis]
MSGATVPTPVAPSYVLTVNGTEHGVDASWLGESLLHVLRERLGLPGSKAGCEQGECGSCSVLVDGDLVCACLVLAAAAVGTEITTVEGLADERGTFTDVQQAFVDAGAVQCGFCTPGLVVAVHDLLDRVPEPTDLEVREALSGNLCRCTGYGRVVAAVEAAVAVRTSGGAP